MRVAAIALITAVSAGAYAQLPNPVKFRLHAGYGFTPSFDDENGDSTSLSGPFVGVEWPIIGFMKVDASVGLTYYSAGLGKDNRADVLRGMAIGRFAVPGSTITLKGGLGYSFMNGKGTIGNSNSAVIQAGIQMPLGSGATQRLLPVLDVYYIGGKKEHSSINIGLTVSF